MSTKKLDETCVNKYKIPLIVMMENAVLSAIKHLDIDIYSKYLIVSGVGNNGGDGLGIARQLKARGKEVNIVIDNWNAVEMLYKLAVEEGEYKFIKGEQAKAIIKHEDLLVVVDNHKKSMSECGDLIEMVDRIVIIDHHRRGEDIIKNPTLVHIEPYASSTCELVSEMLQYVSTEKKGLTNIEAEGLLAGIAVDTKNFSIKTTFFSK